MEIKMPTTHYEQPLLTTKGRRFDYRRRTWAQTLNYHSLKKADLPVNTYDDERILILQDANGGAYYQTNGQPPVPVLAAGFPMTGAEIVTDFNEVYINIDFAGQATRASNDLTLKLLADVSDLKVNLAVMYAEAAKTSTTILGTAKRVADAYRFFRKGNLYAVAKSLNLTPNTVHKNWLEYKYGWMPLLMDVKGSAEYFAQQTLGGRPPRFSVQRKAETLISGYSNYTYAAYGGGSAEVRRGMTATYFQRRKLWCEVVNPHFNTLQQLGLTNPALVAWELIPFSFVFDWFVSVGDWLAGLTALNGVTLRRSLHSNINDILMRRVQPRTVRFNGPTTYVNDERVAEMKKRHYHRNPFTVDPFALSIPLKAPNSFSKLVTGLALLKGNHRHS
jgi:hypothetical protein